MNNRSRLSAVKSGVTADSARGAIRPTRQAVTPGGAAQPSTRPRRAIYGDADPSLTYQVSGLKNGDTAGAVLNGGSLSRVAGENVGVYGINHISLALDAVGGRSPFHCPTGKPFRPEALPSPRHVP